MNLNEKAMRYVEIKKLISSLEKEKEAISAQFKEKGTFSTADFVISVEDEVQNRTVSVDELIQILGHEEVLNKNLTKRVEIKKLFVKPKAKKESAA